MSVRADAGAHFRRRSAVVAAILAFAWALAGCTSSGSDSTTDGGDGALEPGVETGVDRDEAAAGEDATADRSIIVTGAMYMTVEDPIAAADRATGIVEGAGGRVDARAERAPDEYDGGAAQLTLRIPADALDAVVDDIRDLGTVDEFSTSAADVTREVQDLEARISTLRASTARIEALLTQAEDIADIIALESELDRRQAELESLEAHQRGLDDQVSLSRIELSLTTEPVVIVDDAPRTFWGGVESGWNALVAFLSGALVTTGVLLPWLAAAALVLAIVLIAVRATRSRRSRIARDARTARAAAASSGSSEAPPEPADAGARPTLERD